MVIADESFHGSDLEIIADRYGIDMNRIVPHASNVNPLGISSLAKQALMDNIDAICSYPDPNYTTLKNAISNYTGASADHLILGNGTSELIRLVFKILAPKKTMIIGPTYSEYGKAAKQTGSDIHTYMLKESDGFELDPQQLASALDASFDLLVICNPNNPTGKAIPKNKLEQIITDCQSKGILVTVDETYVEFVDQIDLISAVSLTDTYKNLIVFRGISKFFSSPGLRLGYAITTNPQFLDAASNDKTPWSINSLVSVASVMFSDEHFINLSRTLIQTERNLIYSALSVRKTIKVYKPDANFVLIRLLKEGQTASEVFDYCIKRGIMIRDCTDYEGLGEKYIRFCFLKPEENDNVVNTILEIV
ncbi:MAG: histidinol-phosphate transaminase [Eubacteriales bacterium]|nr:histidinol-phosphate transaminase [Eubacteriales bacterium]